MSRAAYLPRHAALAPGLLGRARGRWRQLEGMLGQSLANAGLPPALLGQRWRPRVPAPSAADAVEPLHEAVTVPAPLPFGTADRDALSAEEGWFGFSMRDVPERRAGPTRRLSLHDARVLAGASPDGQFAPAVLDRDGRGVELREVRFRPFHAALATRPADVSVPEAFWVAERVFDNFSHWFSAHLPKIVLLRDLGLLEHVVLPTPRPSWIDESLRMVGIDPGRLAELARGQVLAARTLHLIETDRFRPELLRTARQAAAPPAGTAGERVFISRAAARGRRVMNQAALDEWLARHGFRSVAMEALPLREQASLMARTGVLLAPHGAGLTNMLFCTEGTAVIEIADPAYPNPNFYAMASALGLPYGYVSAEGDGAQHPLDRDLRVDLDELDRVMEALPATARAIGPAR